MVTMVYGFPLKMVIFPSYVSLPDGKFHCLSCPQKKTVRFSKIHDGPKSLVERSFSSAWQNTCEASGSRDVFGKMADVQWIGLYKGKMSLFWGKMSLFWGKMSLFWGKMSLFLGENVTFLVENVTFFGEMSLFWVKMSLFWVKGHFFG